MNKISDDLILNSPNGSNGFSLTHINMYILHVYLHVKKYVADITFSIILKIKVPTFRSFLKKKGFQTVPRILVHEGVQQTQCAFHKIEGNKERFFL